MALTHKLKDDGKIIYPFGVQCTGYSNTVLTSKKTTKNGEDVYTPISSELTQSVIDLYKSRNEELFKELFEPLKEKKANN